MAGEHSRFGPFADLNQGGIDVTRIANDVKHFGAGPKGQDAIDIAHIVWSFLDPARLAFAPRQEAHQTVQARIGLNCISHDFFEYATRHVKENGEAFEPGVSFGGLGPPRLCEPLSL